MVQSGEKAGIGFGEWKKREKGRSVTAVIRLIYSLYMAGIRPIYDRYTAYSWPISGLYMAHTRLIAGYWPAIGRV